MKKKCKVEGGISCVSISEVKVDGKEFYRYSFEVPESERVTHTMSVPVTITLKPGKPYWERFGYSSHEDMMKASHMHYKTADGHYCATCGTELKDCSLAK